MRRSKMGHDNRAASATRLKLIALLPRLRRFAAVLAGDGDSRDQLLRGACVAMLEQGSPNPHGAPFDRWAFAELYAHWLERLRDHADPMAQGRGDADLFQAAFAGADGEAVEVAETAAILTGLPPQQRCAALLVYGDGFTYEEAATILDTSPQTVIERAARALVALIERGEAAAARDARIETLFPRQRQAG
jgi:RNA polymerase sigma-70 factor (ECF subfamily)